ncbi:MAG TPA: hypothetical protein VGN84_07470 [Solirubrobacterales bacterium]|jgi:hypothetical protein|nr:hypothetical protein [Solirubrobacterales bacterium]
MKEIELVLELPDEDGAEAEFPDEGTLPRTGAIGRASGLDGDRVLQLGVLVSAASVQVLRTWLITRAERLKHARVIWKGRKVFEGYSRREVELLTKALERDLENGAEKEE